MKFGFIGFGQFGKILHEKFASFGETIFTDNSQDNYGLLISQVDWVIIATPPATHYQLAKKCLQKNKNVFCEKPLASTTAQAQELIKLASQNKIHLYVDDVFLFRNEYSRLKKIVNQNLVSQIKFIWKKPEESPDNILNSLTYHDFYLLSDLFGNHSFDNLQIKKANHSILRFCCNYGSIKAEFEYERNFSKKFKQIELIDSQKNHRGVNFSHPINDALFEMIEKLLNNKVNFKKNNQLSLQAVKLIESIKEKISPKIAVVGGGIFGSSCAWFLAKNNYHVDLYEKNSDILQAASTINQYRLHRGYHYPRSAETAITSLQSEKSFKKEYNSALLKNNTDHYYCISKKNSLTSANQFVQFLNNLNLEYEPANLDIVKNDQLDLIIKVKENLIDPQRLKNICWQKLKKHHVKVLLNIKADKNLLKNYDFVIISTYAAINELLSEFPYQQKDYQFELCEKPVLKLPARYQNKSVVILDGPFMCLDPFGNTGNFVMGNVVHAIHQTTVGKSPVIPEKFKNILNKGVIKNPPVTNIKKFIESAQEFFIDIDQAEHLGSMFTYRVVLPNHHHDDARPSLIEKINNNTYVVFSGKIGTCIDVANQLHQLLSFL